MKYISPLTQNKVKLPFRKVKLPFKKVKLPFKKVKLPFKLFAYFLVEYARSFKHKLLPIHDIR